MSLTFMFTLWPLSDSILVYVLIYKRIEVFRIVKQKLGHRFSLKIYNIWRMQGNVEIWMMTTLLYWSYVSVEKRKRMEVLEAGQD